MNKIKNIKSIIFIKLGGSVISDKTKFNKPRINEINKICQDLKELEKKLSQPRVATPEVADRPDRIIQKITKKPFFN